MFEELPFTSLNTLLCPSNRRVRISNPAENDIKNEKIDAKEDIEDVVTRECLLNVATSFPPEESLPTWNWIPVVFRRQAGKKRERREREREKISKN